MEPIEVLNTLASAHPPVGEIEATEYLGRKLTPVNQQNIASARGIQYIDRAAYRLTVDGQVKHPLSLSYADLLAYPQTSRLVELSCVEDRSFIAKWTGPALCAILADAKVKPEARIAIFHTVDFPEGYSSLDLNYIFSNNIIIALKDNDITLPADKGFPFQVVAMNDHKWAKWVTRIELSSSISFRGYSKGNAYNAVFCNCDTDKPWWWPFPWWPF